jgi:hypothetical protein
MSRPATLLVREVDFLMIYSHPIASDRPRGSKQPLTRQNDFAHRPAMASRPTWCKESSGHERSSTTLDLYTRRAEDAARTLRVLNYV